MKDKEAVQETVSLSLCHRHYVSRVLVVDGGQQHAASQDSRQLGHRSLCGEGGRQGDLKLLFYPLERADLE